MADIGLVQAIEIILAIFTGALGALILYTGRNLAAGIISILACATIIFVAINFWWGALITIALIAAIGAYFFLDSQGYI